MCYATDEDLEQNSKQPIQIYIFFYQYPLLIRVDDGLQLKSKRIIQVYIYINTECILQMMINQSRSQNNFYYKSSSVAVRTEYQYKYIPISGISTSTIRSPAAVRTENRQKHIPVIGFLTSTTIHHQLEYAQSVGINIYLCQAFLPLL